MFNSSPSLADIAAVTGGNRNDGGFLLSFLPYSVDGAVMDSVVMVVAVIPQLRLHRLISREDLTIQQS